MPLNIKDQDTHDMAKRLAGLTGVSITKAVKTAIKERLDALQQQEKTSQLVDELDRIARHCANLPRHSDQSADDIISYDENGLPT